MRRLVPVLADGNTDTTRPVLYSGQTQLLTPAGVLPLSFELEADSLEDACNKFPDAVKIAIEQAIEEAREMRREAASRIVVPDAGWACPPAAVAASSFNGVQSPFASKRGHLAPLRYLAAPPSISRSKKPHHVPRARASR